MPFHGATTIGVATTGLNTFLKCGPRAASKAWAARSQRTVAAVAAKGNTMYSKLALAATTIGFSQTFVNIRTTRAKKRFVIFGNINTENSLGH